MPETVGRKVRASRLNQYANEDVFNSNGCSLSTTSATYVNVTSASKSFTKIGGSSDSDLIIELDLSLYATVAPTVVKFGVNVNSTDRDVIWFGVSTANLHLAASGRVRITGLAAGTYTVQVRALRVSGTGTLIMDTNDTVSMVMKERPI